MEKFTLIYTMTICKVVEAENEDEALAMAYDEPPYPKVDGEIITSADVDRVSVDDE